MELDQKAIIDPGINYTNGRKFLNGFDDTSNQDLVTLWNNNVNDYFNSHLKTDDIETVFVLLQDYKKSIFQEVKFFLSSDYLAENIRKHLKLLFHTFEDSKVENSQDIDAYLEVMEDLLTFYFNLELRMLRFTALDKTKVFYVQRRIDHTVWLLSKMLNQFLLGNNASICHVLIRQFFIGDGFTTEISELWMEECIKIVMEKLYTQFLFNSPLIEFTEEAFMRYHILLNQWSLLRPNSSNKLDLLYKIFNYSTEELAEKEEKSKMIIDLLNARPSVLDQLLSIHSMYDSKIIATYFKNLAAMKAKLFSNKEIQSDYKIDEVDDWKFYHDTLLPEIPMIETKSVILEEPNNLPLPKPSVSLDIIEIESDEEIEIITQGNKKLLIVKTEDLEYSWSTVKREPGVEPLIRRPPVRKTDIVPSQVIVLDDDDDEDSSCLKLDNEKATLSTNVTSEKEPMGFGDSNAIILNDDSELPSIPDVGLSKSELPNINKSHSDNNSSVDENHCVNSENKIPENINNSENRTQSDVTSDSSKSSYLDEVSNDNKLKTNSAFTSKLQLKNIETDSTIEKKESVKTSFLQNPNKNGLKQLSNEEFLKLNLWGSCNVMDNEKDKIDEVECSVGKKLYKAPVKKCDKEFVFNIDNVHTSLDIKDSERTKGEESSESAVLIKRTDINSSLSESPSLEKVTINNNKINIDLKIEDKVNIPSSNQTGDFILNTNSKEVSPENFNKPSQSHEKVLNHDTIKEIPTTISVNFNSEMECESSNNDSEVMVQKISTTLNSDSEKNCEPEKDLFVEQDSLTNNISDKLEGTEVNFKTYFSPSNVKKHSTSHKKPVSFEIAEEKCPEKNTTEINKNVKFAQDSPKNGKLLKRSKTDDNMEDSPSTTLNIDDKIEDIELEDFKQFFKNPLEKTTTKKDTKVKSILKEKRRKIQNTVILISNDTAKKYNLAIMDPNLYNPDVMRVHLEPIRDSLIDTWQLVTDRSRKKYEKEGGQTFEKFDYKNKVTELRLSSRVHTELSTKHQDSKDKESFIKIVNTTTKDGISKALGVSKSNKRKKPVDNLTSADTKRRKGRQKKKD